MNDLHSFPIRIYFEDTDFSGNVYHAAYLKFFERARSEWLRDLGFVHSELAAEGRGFVVRNMNIDFIAPAHIDDQLDIRTRFVEGRGAQVLLEQEAWRAEERLSRAIVSVVLVNQSGAPTRLPQGLRKIAG